MSKDKSVTISLVDADSFCLLLALLFIGLRLTGHIDWSWWWVTSPLWVPLAFVVAVGLGGLLILGVFAAFFWLHGVLQPK